MTAPSEYHLRISDVAEINATALRSTQLPDILEYIDITSVGTGVFNSAPSRIRKQDAPGRARRAVKVGDTLISTVRPNRRSFIYLAQPPRNAVASTGFAVLTPTKRIDSRFLYYWISRPEFSEYLSKHAKGSAYPAVSPEDIGVAEIWCPPLPIQRRIAGILSTYDDLIENNLRRIKILEGVARLLYREWFVEFRFPGHEQVRMVDSPLGRIPERWEVSTLGAKSEVIMGQSPKSEFYNDTGEGLPFHQGVTYFGSHFPNHVKYCRLESRIAEAGDTLVSVRAPVGRINVADTRLVIGRGLSAIRPKQPSAGFHYWQLREIFREEDAIGGGTIFKAITKADLLAVPWLVPEEQLMEKFEQIERPMFDLLANLTQKTNHLRRTRDLLLPRLMSGQLDLSKVEQEHEETAL